MLCGILLDVDGTLLLSNAAHARAWAETLAEFGHDIPAERIQPLIGMGGDRLLPALVPGLSTEEGEGKRIADRRQELFLECYVRWLKPAPGTRDFLLFLRELGLDLVVATSAKREELQALLKAAGIDDLIQTETTTDDAEESKPAPDIVEAALARSGLEPHEVLMIGDTPYDVESATRAGVGIIALRCGGHSDEALRGALAIYDDPQDLCDHYADSPIGRREEAVGPS